MDPAMKLSVHVQQNVFAAYLVQIWCSKFQAMAPTAAVLSGIKACHENARPDLEEVCEVGETM